MTGKVALVTGGARGIGGAISRALALAGADVLIADLRHDDAHATAARLHQETGRRVEAQAADVTHVEDMQAAAQAAMDRFGGLDVLVNNAGWDRLVPFLKSTPDLWERIISINYRGVINSCYAVLPHLKARGHGAIVNISSDSARVGSLGEAVYSGAKAAVVAFSKTLAREHARDNIRVNVVCPGLVDTPLLEEIKHEEFGGKILGAVTGAIPLKRLGRPCEIAPVVAFLASEDAGYITGQVISVNGGLTMAG
ncbi:MAG TPA: SDR family NAD(P)-dependent oxidoreductase [Terriglobales bacterium]|nr:SDR family NAD(P)-dependent oxidoreductase [Terriglobales bacterium]